MKREIADIVAAFKEAQQSGRQAALATVVHVEGSSYRRPGARMLVEDNGKMTGAISGGCLEGDALRKALQAISQQQARLVTYNTLDDDDVQFGVQLGCNGIVHILFEPIGTTRVKNPISLLESCLLHRKDAVLVTVFSLQDYYGHQAGTCFLLNDEGAFGTTGNAGLDAEIRQDAAMVLAEKKSVLNQYEPYGCAALVALMEPPVSLVVVGAGNDALPLVAIAAVLGWNITVIDGRATHANKQRFSKVNQIIVGKPPEAMQQVAVDERTVFVLMTHNYNYDLETMRFLINKQCRYIGILGPRKRLERIMTELEQTGIVFTEQQKGAIYGPTGLDIGAEAAEEIALAIVAEIKAVLMKRNGTSLRERSEAIHARPATTQATTQTAT